MKLRTGKNYRIAHKVNVTLIFMLVYQDHLRLYALQFYISTREIVHINTIA